MRADQKGLSVIFCAWRGERVKKERVSWAEEGEEGGGIDLDLVYWTLTQTLSSGGGLEQDGGWAERLWEVRQVPHWQGTTKGEQKNSTKMKISVNRLQSLIKRFGVWASSMCSPSQFFLSCLLSALSGWVQSHCFFHFCQNCSFFCVKLILLGNIDGEEFDNLTCPLHYVLMAGLE